MSTPNILVTGGAGYVGSHTCKALARAGFCPIAYDNLVYGHERFVKWGPFEKGDILDLSRLGAVIAAHKPRAVLHFAAFAYVGESVGDPAKYYRNNVAGTLTLLEAMRQHDVGQIVFSSTCATYGIPDAIPISETAPQRPINPYGASKLMVERILRDYGSAYGLRSVFLRYFNAAGADADGELGEEHSPETHLIPLVLDVAAGNRPNITVFGNDYETPDGTCIRDYVHVSDLADAHVLAMKRLETGGAQHAYNLGTGRGFSVTQVIEAARSTTGKNIRVVKGPRRPGDPAVLLADPSQAKGDLGWNPQYPEIADIVASAWRWSSNNSQLSRD